MCDVSGFRIRVPVGIPHNDNIFRCDSFNTVSSFIHFLIQFGIMAYIPQKKWLTCMLDNTVWRFEVMVYLKWYLCARYSGKRWRLIINDKLSSPFNVCILLNPNKWFIVLSSRLITFYDFSHLFHIFSTSFHIFFTSFSWLFTSFWI